MYLYILRTFKQCFEIVILWLLRDLLCHSDCFIQPNSLESKFLAMHGPCELPFIVKRLSPILGMRWEFEIHIRRYSAITSRMVSNKILIIPSLWIGVYSDVEYRSLSLETADGSGYHYESSLRPRTHPAPTEFKIQCPNKTIQQMVFMVSSTNL
jgi:hypothetical protein